MIHYSCDRCKRIIDPAHEPHYRLKIDAQPVLEPLDLQEPEDDRDHLAELNLTLDGLDVDQEDFASAEGLQRGYDLCSECYQRFARDPLAAEHTLRLGFSRN